MFCGGALWCHIYDWHQLVGRVDSWTFPDQWCKFTLGQHDSLFQHFLFVLLHSVPQCLRFSKSRMGKPISTYVNPVCPPKGVARVMSCLLLCSHLKPVLGVAFLPLRLVPAFLGGEKLWPFQVSPNICLCQGGSL